MKSTTFQQKAICTVKILACAIVIGVLGWLSFSPTPKSMAGAAGDVVLSVTVAYSAPTLGAIAGDSSGNVTQNVVISGSSYNVASIEVYLDVNGDGIIDSGDIKLSGSVSVANDGSLDGVVALPNGLSEGSHQLIVLGHVIQTGPYPNTVQNVVNINYTRQGPSINCVYNDGSFCMPGSSAQAFGSVHGGNIIVIEGNYFGSMSDTSVTIGGGVCEIISVSNNKITCSVPKAKSGQVGAQNIVVCVNGLCNALIGGFLYQEIDGIPGIPNTGVFRMGDTIVTTKDLMLWGGLLIVIIATIMLIMIIKTSKSAQNNVKNKSNKKQNRRNQKSSKKK